MGNALGSVAIEMYADTVRLQSDLGKAAAMVDARMAQIGRAARMATGAIAAIGVGAALSEFASKMQSVIDATADLADLSEKTGASVESLSALAGAAKLSGTGVDELAGGLQKLNKATIDAQNGGDKTSAAFNAIGISIADLKGKAPDEVFRLLADRLALYADGAEKTVVVQTLLGKAGANLLPVLNDLAEVGNYQVKVTTEQAQMADELDKNQTRLKASTDALYRVIGLELVPSMNVFVKTLLDANNETDGLRGSVNRLASEGSIASWAETSIKFLAKVVDGFQLAGREFGALTLMLSAGAESGSKALTGDFEGARKVLAKMNADLTEIDKQPLFSQRLEKNLADQKTAAAAPPAPPRPRIDAAKIGNANAQFAKAPAVPKDDPTKKILEGELKAREQAIADEKSILQSRLEAVDFYRNLEYLNLRDAETKKQDLLRDNLAATQTQYDLEINLLKKAIAEKDKLIGDEKGFVPDFKKGTGKKLERERSQEEQNAADKVRTERQDLVNKLGDVSAKRGVNEIEVNKQIEESSRRLLAVQRELDIETQQRSALSATANANLAFEIENLGKNTLEVEKLAAARRIQLDLDQRIARIKRQDPNADVSDAQAQAAQQTIDQQSLIVAGYMKQRDASFGASEAIRRYQDEATNAGAQIQNALSNAFRGAEDAMLSFIQKGDFSIRGLKAGFRGLADSIVADITRMIIKQSVMAPLMQMMGMGGGGGATGGGFIASLIGTGISMLTGTANPNIGPPVPGRAAGGPVSAGGLYRINELNRPEVLEVSGKQFLMMGDRAGMVTPNNLTPGGREYLTMGRDGADSGPQTVSNNATSILNVHVTPPAGASRETAMQWGSMAGRQIQAATRRNG